MQYRFAIDNGAGFQGLSTEERKPELRSITLNNHNKRKQSIRVTRAERGKSRVLQ